MGNSLDIAEQIMSELKKYSNEVTSQVNVSSEKCAKKLRTTLKRTSPKKTGDYGKGWRVKQTHKGRTLSVFVVHNATDYQLTHLLEYGHAVKGGTKRVKAIEHIKPAEEQVINEFLSEVEKAIQEAGNG